MVSVSVFMRTVCFVAVFIASSMDSLWKPPFSMPMTLQNSWMVKVAEKSVHLNLSPRFERSVFL